jgi:two-component system, sensor histidine kinase LadS
MKRALILTFLIPALFCVHHAAMAGTVEIDPKTHRYDLNPHLDILVDSGRSLTIDQVASPEMSDQFLSTDETGVSFGFTKSAVWLRIDLSNPSTSAPGKWRLVFEVPSIEYAELYIPDDTGGFSVMKSGLTIPVSKKPLPTRSHVFPIDVPPGSHKTLYLRAASFTSMVIAVWMATPELHDRMERGTLLVLLFFGGIFFTIVIYNLMLLITLRDPIYLYLVFFVGSFALFLGVNFGPATLYLWPEHPTWANLASPLFGGMALFWGALFAGVFVPVKKVLPRVYPVLFTVTVAAGLTIPMTFINRFVANVMDAAIGAILYCIAIVLCIYALLKLKEPNKFFLLAMIAALLGGLQFILMVFGLLPLNVWTFGVGPIAFLIGMLFFVMVLGNRYSVDISTRKQLERRVKSDTMQISLYNDILAHDIGNINHTSLTYLGLLLSEDFGELNEQQRSFVEKCRLQIHRCSGLTEKIKTLSSVRENHAPELAPFDLDRLLSQVIEQIKDPPSGKNVNVAFTPSSGRRVMTDHLAVQLFHNLLENAINHSAKDKVTITVAVRPEKQRSAGWQIVVEDDGPGIPDESKKNLFDRSLRMRPTEGPGLGLAIVKALVLRYGGDVRIEDRVAGNSSAGTRFVVWLPSV